MARVSTPNKFGSNASAIGSGLKSTPRIAEQHRIASTNFEAAAKYHEEAAKQNEAGNLDKASKSTKKALEYSKIANESQNEVLYELNRP